MIFLFGGKGTKNQVLFRRRVAFSSVIACFHFGCNKASLYVRGFALSKFTATKTQALGLKMPALDLVIV